MVMLLTIVPMFASMYDSMNAQLPFVTQILVDLGKVMPYVLPMLIVAVAALAMFWKRNRNKDIIRTWVGSVHTQGTGVRQAGHQRGPGPLLQ